MVQAVITSEVKNTEAKDVGAKLVARWSEANEHVCEVRYAPDSRIVDRVGTIAHSLVEPLELPKWSVTNNRADLHTEDKRRSAFVSFKNAGFVAANTFSANYFPDQAARLFKQLGRMPEFATGFEVARIGVRSRFALPVKLEFPQLVEAFQRRFGVSDAAAARDLGIAVSDFGVTLIGRDEYGKVSLNFGPTPKDQFAVLFQVKSEFPEVGVYCDVDYHQEGLGRTSAEEVTRIVRELSGAAWRLAARIHDRVTRE